MNPCEKKVISEQKIEVKPESKKKKTTKQLYESVTAR